MSFKVILEGGTKVGSVSFFPLKLDLVEQELPISTDYCGEEKMNLAYLNLAPVSLVLLHISPNQYMGGGWTFPEVPLGEGGLSILGLVQF